MKKSNFVRLGLVGAIVTAGCTAGTATGELPYGGGSNAGGPAGVDPTQIGPGTTGPAMPKGPAPSYGATTTLANSPPPISGGTLLALADGTHVVAADSDRDRVYVVDLTTNAVATVPLSSHDEPGRVVEDGHGLVHVVLRSGGAIATIDPSSATLLARRNACVSPRGIAYDPQEDRLVVACEPGQIVTLPASMFGEASPLTTRASGLRDILVVNTPGKNRTPNESIYVSRFRTAEVMHLSMKGALLSSSRPDSSTVLKQNAESTLAWRMIPAPSGSTSQDPIVVHQFASLQPVATTPGGYGGGGAGGPMPEGAPGAVMQSCSLESIVTPAISQGATPLTTAPTTLVMPVDMVSTKNGFAVISAGNGHTSTLAKMFVLNAGSCGTRASQYTFDGQPIAIAQLANGNLIVQSREPATLTTFVPAAVNSANEPGQANYTPYTMSTSAEGKVPLQLVITLSSDVSVEDTGHAIFHSNSGSGVACASCHGEGADDGHVWSFDQLGARRTPSLRGTINGTAPYHWDGTMTDIGMLADEVMTGRMNGPQLATDQKAALQSWLFAIPSPPLTTTADAALVAQGQALFNSASVGCSGCHSGPRFTNNTTVNVGTGGSFQVPPLIGVRARAPYLHNGCALTLRDRFGICATPQHGNTMQLQSTDIDALVAFLESI